MQGVCQRVVIASAQNHPLAIRVDADGTVYWINRGSTVENDHTVAAAGAAALK